MIMGIKKNLPFDGIMGDETTLREANCLPTFRKGRFWQVHRVAAQVQADKSMLHEVEGKFDLRFFCWDWESMVL